MNDNSILISQSICYLIPVIFHQPSIELKGVIVSDHRPIGDNSERIDLGKHCVCRL